MLAKTHAVFRSTVAQRSFANFTKAPVRIAITGASGNISYATAFRVAA